jgi:hypothetical protein
MPWYDAVLLGLGAWLVISAFVAYVMGQLLARQ